MVKRKIAAIVAALSLVASAGVFADNIGPGLGRVLLKGKQGKVMELLGMTLNGISGNGMFAITFGTLGYQEGAEIGMAATNTFIAENLDALATDIAKGDGEYLDTLSTMLNVSDPVAFKSTVQKNFDEIFYAPDVTAQEVS
ncbi:MAG: DUF3015 domain-containing protein, partial [Treponema sp.]|nr:DUF3015 domain-containing protein [Treponema sp.]